jgi:hypothetical protein
MWREVGMFSFAIVLSEEDLKVLVSDFVEVLRDELGGDAEVTAEQLAEVLADLFEELLDEYEVDEAVVKVGGVCREVGNGEKFVALVEEFYGDLMGILSSESEVRGEGTAEGESEMKVVDK